MRIAGVIYFIALLVFTGCGRPKLAKSAYVQLKLPSLSNTQVDTLVKYVKNMPNQTELAIAFVKNGEVNFVGVKRFNDTLFDIENKQALFEIGSITKVITTTILAALVTKGSMSLNQNIRSVFPFKFNQNLSFNCLELANHTSGLGRLPGNLKWSAIFNQDNPYKNYSDAKFDDYLKNNISLEYDKGSKSVYSNLGMGLLAYTMRIQCKSSYETLAQKFVFKPFNMTTATTLKPLVGVVQGFNAYGKQTPNWEPGALVGAGGVYASVTDLVKFSIAHFDTSNVVLTLTRKPTFTENEKIKVGLGWFILPQKNNSTWYWHNGGTGGYSSSMVMDISNKNAVIVLANLSSYHPLFEKIDELAFVLMKTLY